MDTVDTKDGVRRGSLDSWVGMGEVLTDINANHAHVVKRGSKVGVDDVPAITKDAAVMGNDEWPLASILNRRPTTFAQATYNAGKDIEEYNKKHPEISDVIKQRLGTGTLSRNTAIYTLKNKQAAIGLLLEFMKFAQEQQRELHSAQKENKIYANKGKSLPQFKFGEDQLGNIISSSMGTTMGLGQFLMGYNQPINNPVTYASNPYERQGLTTLAGLRDNPYNQLRAMQDVESRNRYATNQSGGLTGALKYLANVASGIGLLKNYADILNRSNQLNNQYRSQWATAALQTGTQNAQRLQQSNLYRDEAYAKSHGARQQMMQLGMQNMLGLTQQYFANEFKRSQFERMMELYWAEVNNKKNNNNSNNSNNSEKSIKTIPNTFRFAPRSLPSSLFPTKEAIPTVADWKTLMQIQDRYRY